MPPQNPLDALMQANGAIGSAPPPTGLSLSASTPSAPEDDPLDALMQANGGVTAPRPVEVETDEGLGAFARHTWAGANPLNIGQMLPWPKALGGSGVDNPFNPVKDAEARKVVKDEADALWAQGNYPVAVLKYLESFTPYLGPMMAQQGDQLQKGQYAAAAGDLTGMYLGAKVVPKVVGAALRSPRLVRPAVDPVNQLAENIGVRQSVGEATGNRPLQASGQMAGYTPIGAFIDYFRRRNNTAALARANEGVRQSVRGGGTVDATEAGTNLAAQLESRVQAERGYGQRQYGVVEQAVEAPNQTRVVVPRSGEPPVLMQMPIDIRPVRTVLRPVWNEIQTFTAESRRGMSNAIRSLESLMEGDDFMPQQVAEKHLGRLKELMRESDGNTRRLTGMAVRDFQRQINRSVQQADPTAYRALRQGRASWRAKAQTEALRDKVFKDDPNFREEGAPVRRLLGPEDAGSIRMLERVRAQSPTSIPGLARTFVDRLLDYNGEKMLAEWRKFGPRKKAVLFTPDQITLLDNLTELHARLARVENTSRTATSLMSVAVGNAMGLGAWSFILQSPTAVHLATRAVRLGLQPAGTLAQATARAVQVGALMKAATQAADAQPDEDDADQ